VSWTVYLLQCGDGSLYAGITNNLAKRVAAHRAGRGSAYTRSRRPLVVVYEEPCANRAAALRREAAIKRLDRTAKLRLARGGP
jgi:putative endonuclease